MSVRSAWICKLHSCFQSCSLFGKHVFFFLDAASTVNYTNDAGFISLSCIQKKKLGLNQPKSQLLWKHMMKLSSLSLQRPFFNVCKIIQQLTCPDSLLALPCLPQICFFVTCIPLFRSRKCQTSTINYLLSRLYGNCSI